MVECTCLTRNNDPSLEHQDHCKVGKNAEILVFRNEVGQPISVPQSVVLENDRTYRAHQLHVQGMTWAQVAAKEGYDSAAQAMYDVRRWLAECRAMISEYSRREMLQLEVSRLDALQAAVWPQAMKGSIPAVNAARDLIITRTKMLRLDEMSEVDSSATTVIVPADDKGYLAALERVANGS